MRSEESGGVVNRCMQNERYRRLLRDSGLLQVARGDLGSLGNIGDCSRRLERLEYRQTGDQRSSSSHCYRRAWHLYYQASDFGHEQAIRQTLIGESLIGRLTQVVMGLAIESFRGYLGVWSGSSWRPMRSAHKSRQQQQQEHSTLCVQEVNRKYAFRTSD